MLTQTANCLKWLVIFCSYGKILGHTKGYNMKSNTFFLTTGLFILVSLLTLPVSGQNTPKPEFGLPAQTMPFHEYETHGQLLSLKIVPSSKETRLYIIGNEAASLSVDKYAVHGQVMMGRHRKSIDFKRGKDYFSTEEKINGELLNLKLEEIETKKIEEFKIKLKRP